MHALDSCSSLTSRMGTQVKGIRQVEDDELNAVNEREAQTLEERLAKAGIPSAE